MSVKHFSCSLLLRISQRHHCQQHKLSLTINFFLHLIQKIIFYVRCHQASLAQKELMRLATLSCIFLCEFLLLKNNFRLLCFILKMISHNELEQYARSMPSNLTLSNEFPQQQKDSLCKAKPICLDQYLWEENLHVCQ